MMTSGVKYGFVGSISKFSIVKKCAHENSPQNSSSSSSSIRRHVYFIININFGADFLCAFFTMKNLEIDPHETIFYPVFLMMMMKYTWGLRKASRTLQTSLSTRLASFPRLTGDGALYVNRTTGKAISFAILSQLNWTQFSGTRTNEACLVVSIACDFSYRRIRVNSSFRRVK